MGWSWGDKSGLFNHVKIFSWLNVTYKELDKQANLSFKKIWILTTKIYNCNEQAKMTFWINFLIQNFITFFPVKTWGYFGLVNWYVFHFVFIDWKNIFWSVPPCINLLTYLLGYFFIDNMPYGIPISTKDWSLLQSVCVWRVVKT